jgi:hypothetical protein
MLSASKSIAAETGKPNIILILAALHNRQREVVASTSAEARDKYYKILLRLRFVGDSIDRQAERLRQWEKRYPQSPD